MEEKKIQYAEIKAGDGKIINFALIKNNAITVKDINRAIKKEFPRIKKSKLFVAVESGYIISILCKDFYIRKNNKPIRKSEKVSGYIRNPGSIWIDNNSAAFNNEWVAADQNGMVGHDPSIDKLMEKLQSKNIKMEDITIAFITTDIVQ